MGQRSFDEDNGPWRGKEKVAPTRRGSSPEQSVWAERQEGRPSGPALLDSGSEPAGSASYLHAGL